MNTSTQTLSTLLPKTSFKNFTVFALCFIGAFVAYQAENPARMVAAFILLATVSLVAYLAFCLIRFTFKVLAKQPNANVQKTQVKQPAKNAQSNSPVNARITNARRANVVRRMPGEELMDIPAYARKAMARDYPMSVDKLKTANFTVSSSQPTFSF
ncbi:hypothetical protein DDN26_14565 [Vibrio cholerae]|jgi:hypothetical protein|nr:hypothetical protein [Vibrio cholerae]